MTERFNFEESRDSLAKELGNTRAGDKEKARVRLREIQQTEAYSDSRALHLIKKTVPTEEIDRMMTYRESADDPDLWNIQDVDVPEKYYSVIDSQILRDLSQDRAEDLERDEAAPYRANAHKEWEKHHSFEKDRKLEETRERAEFLNKISGGRLFDRHNLNHAVGGQPNPSAAKAFNRYSAIKQRSDFWMSTAGPMNDGELAYGSGYLKFLGKPVIIVSPKNIRAREFFKHSMEPGEEKLLGTSHRTYQDLPKRYPYFFFPKPVYKEGDFIGFSVSESYGHEARLLFLANQPLVQDSSDGIRFKFKPERSPTSWMDIADCLIDLRVKKTWTRIYTETEKASVEEDIQKYRAFFEKGLEMSFESYIEKHRPK